MKILMALLLLGQSSAFASTYTFECAWDNRSGEGYENVILIKTEKKNFQSGGGISTFQYSAFNETSGMVVRNSATNAQMTNAKLQNKRFSFDLSMGRSGSLSVSSDLTRTSGNANVSASFMGLAKAPTPDVMCRFFDGSGITR